MSSISINELIDKTNKCKIILPNFQREFEWDRNQQRDLLASILTNIPSGSLLLLKGEKTSFKARKIGFTENVDDINLINDEPLFLLDGQQRSTSIHSFFIDFFDHNSRHKSESIFSKIHTRWFLYFNSEIKNFFGFDTLTFSQENLDKSTPLDIVDSIIYFRDINKKKSPKFYDISYELKTKIIESTRNYYLPLQLLKNNINDFNKAIYTLATNRLGELNSKLENCQWVPILETIEPSISKLMSDLLILKGQALDDLEKEIYRIKLQHIYRWITDVQNYFKSIINQNIPTIELEPNHICKASVIFEYLNKGGTKLTTFDLFTAKFYKLDIRNRINEKIETEIDVPGSFKTSYLSKWNPNWFSITNSNDGLSKIFEDQFLNTLSLLVHLNKSQGNIDNIKIDHIKRDSILALKESEISGLIDNAINGLIRTYCFLQLKCGVIKITDISYELQILPMTLLFSEDKYWAKRINKECTAAFEKLEYYNWITLFSGRYSKLQNEQSIKDIKLIYSWIEKKKSIEDSYGTKSNAFKWILNLEDFVNEDILMMKNTDSKTPTSIEQAIHSYILSKEPMDLDIEKKGFDKIQAFKIGMGEYELEEHHLIPISQGKEKYSDSTKVLRKNKSHILNSILNKAYIRKESNRYISNLPTQTYIDEIVKKHGTLPLSDFFIPYNASNFKPNKISQNNFVKDRFLNLKQSIDRDLKSIVKKYET
jgi:hypothetical protein